jgi:CelD/BcsL family acetyltransferase involved in cellulose biosynthesis
MNGYPAPIANQVLESEQSSLSIASAGEPDRLLDFSHIDARNAPQWPEFARHRFGSLFSCPYWIGAIAETYGFAINASVRTNGGRIEAAIPYCRISDLRGDRIVSLPFSDYCDPLVTDGKTWKQLIATLLAEKVPISLRCLKSDAPAADDRFQRKVPALWHGVDLTRSEEELWGGLHSSARQNVRKAQAGGVVVRDGRTVEDMRLFHRMHSKLRKSKYRLLAQPLAFFENIFYEFARTDGVNVLIAEQDGEPIAGIVLLEWNGTLYYKFNASLDQRYCPNDLLAWHSLRYGRQRGMVRFDFGLSDLEQPGLIRYKRKFATDEREITFLQWRPEGYANPKGEQAGLILSQVTGWLTDATVPDEITRAASEKLYRFFC